MDLFEYVMVLASIVIGLAMTHLLQGLLGIIQKRPRVYWVHLVWVGFAFFQTVFWWWWEFRYSLVEAWTLPLYLFIIGYAFLIYLFCGLLFPDTLEGYGDFKTYFYKRRAWFFSMLRHAVRRRFRRHRTEGRRPPRAPGARVSDCDHASRRGRNDSGHCQE